ncbi:response regulator transcription factor [Marinobacterium sedimentorum]|uniref:response regulator transcription factor n=1 Tax=Marinobacterium sedimentorum TaxID=2927804 RepID=UPI0020C5C315|nr:response regulator transcription factor [Marinobacterium sedimentorum]MCP8686371.1 response regulator transcription factor [Marinobacterium sedimentorum]
MKERLLLVDDDVELCELLGDYLRHEGYEIDCAHNAREALVRLEGNHPYSLMVLDVMMPGQSGLELLQQMRPRVQLPVIMLTGRGEEIDRILGLEMGADDYLGKPCNPRELLARIRAIRRRSEVPAQQTEFPQRPIELHGIRLDPGQREVRVAGEVVELTSAEFNVLAYLLHNAGRVMSKAELTERVLHRPLTAYDRAIDVHVSRLRQKLQRGGDSQELIKTLRGEGYLLVLEAG